MWDSISELFKLLQDDVAPPFATIIEYSLNAGGPERDAYTIAKDFAGPLATASAALIAAWITHKFAKAQRDIAERQVDINSQKFEHDRDISERQTQLNSEKLRHDLFENRFNVYYTIIDFLYNIQGYTVRPGANIKEEFAPLVKAIEMARLLFPSERDLWSRTLANASSLVTTGQMLQFQQSLKTKFSTTHAEISAKEERIKQLLDVIKSDIPIIQMACRPYLEFK